MLKYGGPQGFILGPLLFVFRDVRYEAKIVNNNKTNSFRNYAWNLQLDTDVYAFDNPQ